MANAPAGYMSPVEAAEYVSLSRTTIDRAIHAGKLPARKTGKNGGGRTLIRVADIDAWFDSLADA